MSGALDGLTDTCSCGCPVLRIVKGGRQRVLSFHRGTLREHWRDRRCDDLASARARAVEGGEAVPLSYSELAAYESCPACYRLRKQVELAGHRLPQHPAATDGRLFHRHVGDLLLATLRGSDPADVRPDLSSLLTADRREAFMAWRRVVLRVVGPRIQQLRDRRSRVMVEQPLLTRFTTPSGAAVQWKAVSDLVIVRGRHASVWDWKTGWEVPERGRMPDDLALAEGERSPEFPNHAIADDVAHSLQAGGNVMTLFDRLPDLDLVTFHFVATRYPRTPMRSTDFTRADLERFRGGLAKRCDRLILDTEFRPRSGGHHLTGAGHAIDLVAAALRSGGIVVPEITSRATASVTYDMAQALSSVGKELRMRVLDYSRRSGETIASHGGQVLSHEAARSYRLRDQQVVGDALRSRGLDPRHAFVKASLSKEFCDLNGAVLEEIARQHPDALSIHERRRVLEVEDPLRAYEIRQAISVMGLPAGVDALAARTANTGVARPSDARTKRGPEDTGARNRPGAARAATDAAAGMPTRSPAGL